MSIASNHLLAWLRTLDVRKVPLVASEPSGSQPDSKLAPAGTPRPPRSADPGRALEDCRLVERIAGGDDTALAALYDRYAKPAYSLARRICIDEVLAEDVVQEVFLLVWRDPSRYQSARGAFSSWLLTVVHHKAVDAVRREGVHRRRQVVMDESTDRVAPETPGADQDAVGRLVGVDVRKAIDDLPPEQAKTMMLAYYGGYTQREVAAIVGVPLGTVKSRMFAASQRLRTALGGLAIDFGLTGPGVEGKGL